MTMIDHLSPGQALREAREAAGYLQKDLALVLGISTSYLSDIELGYKRLSQEIASKLPPPIRGPVINAMVAEASATISTLIGIGNG
jgi:DNA-binding XRE family transcriptional regulator